MSNRDNATCSQTDLPLAKAEPISNNGSTSGITYLRRGKKPAQLQPERGMRICERNNSADIKVSEEGGGGGASGARAEVPLQLMMKTMVRQVVPLQPMEVHGGADLHLQPMEGTPRRSRGMPEGGCDPMGSLRWSRFLPGPVASWRKEPTPEQVCWQGLCPRGGPTLEQPVPEGLHPVGGTHAGAVVEELQPMGRTHVGEVCGELSPMGGASRWSRERV